MFPREASSLDKVVNHMVGVFFVTVHLWMLIKVIA